jgi:hypothetical protein
MEILVGSWRAKAEEMVEMQPRYHVDLHGLACTAAQSGHHENAQHGDARWENFAVMLLVFAKLTNCRRALSQAYP